MTLEARELRVLVADDDPSLRLALTLSLERRGHTVQGAETTDLARALIRAQAPHVVLIDAGMPRSGVELWMELDEGGGEGPVALLLTGDVYALGALARHPRVIEKPFGFAALIERIEALAAW